MLLKKRRRPNFSVATYHFPDAHPSFGSCGLDDFSMLGWQWAVNKTCTLNSILLCKRGPYDDLLQCPYTVSGIIPCTTQTTKVFLNQLTLSPNQLRKRWENFLLRSAHIPFSSSHLLTHYNRQLPDILNHLKAGRNLWLFWLKKRNPSFHAQMKHPTTMKNIIGCWLDAWLSWKKLRQFNKPGGSI